MSSMIKIGPLRVRPQILRGKETGKWFLDVSANITSSGRRIRKLFDNRTEATKALQAAMEQTDMIGLNSSTRRNNGILFHELVARWVDHEQGRVRTRKKRASSLKTDLYRLERVKVFFGTMDAGAISESDMVAYQERRLGDGVSPVTVNGEMANGLLKVLRWGKKQGWLSEIASVEPIPEPVKAVEIPTMEEVGRLLDALTPSTRPLILFLAETGCRSGEAFHLTWDCVDELGPRKI